MYYKELSWKKNVKPIKSQKIILESSYKINIKLIKNIKPFKIKNTNYISKSKCSNLVFCIDNSTKLKVDKGKYSISNKLDLHGCNIENAYYKLINFIIKNYQEGNRCLLIITGKSNITNKIDTIKNNLNKWLNDIKVQHIILYYKHAINKHGGKGAFYVLLRKNKDIVKSNI